VSKREKQKILNWTLTKDRRHLSMDYNIPKVSNDQIKSVIVEELKSSQDESARRKWKNYYGFLYEFQ